MYHICRYYPSSYWNIYNDSPSSSTGCCDTLEEALITQFSSSRYSLEKFEEEYDCKSILSVDSLSDIERLYPEYLI